MSTVQTTIMSSVSNVMMFSYFTHPKAKPLTDLLL